MSEMENNESRSHKRRRREKKKCVEITPFPLLLAATLTSSRNRHDSRQYLIKKCLNNLQLSNQETLPSIQSLLPVLLKSRFPEIACRSAEIVGAVSMLSLQMNERVVSDDETVKALISALGSPNRRVSMAACNALLDLSTTSVARRRLLEFSALDCHLVRLCPGKDTSICFTRILLEKDELSISFLHAAITLINSCTAVQLEKIPMLLSESFLVVLKKLWANAHNQVLLGNSLKSSEDCRFLVGIIRTNELAETIFRLSTKERQFPVSLSSTLVKNRIWGEPSFKSFISDSWEASPLLVRRLFRPLIEENDVLSSFVQSLNCEVSFPTFLSSMLQNFVSCLPIASDELDILSFLDEVRNELGCPIIYQQDIRVIRTEKQSKKEVHFFHNDSDPCSIKPTRVFSIDNIKKCEEAYKEGYTIALRGMEFRFASIAAIADALASLFGQPSVGANLYLTPPNSQGLAVHTDDHCVFVCQLFGMKQWTIYSQSNLLLPRLYDPLDSIHSKVDGSLAGHMKFLLSEGDILYIPRGFPHEACTDDIEFCGFARFSLHLTFGIEVEPPFEWEGFVHVALYCWDLTQKQPHHAFVEPLPGIPNVIFVNLLHAMIELISTYDPAFQKACLVAALSAPLDTSDWFYLSQLNMFTHLIEKISRESRFLEMLEKMESAIERKENPFPRMRWLQHLYPERVTFKEHDWNMAFMEVQNLLPEDKEKAEATFIQIKTRFCSKVVFEDVIDTYKLLLEKYKKSRKQYMNGMLSLHSN
uniref:Bifunctional lysine-specific demethylase and histidyl-hydroxylase n=1 Tax=Rhizophora mucronata TaxID=61149 RepID=A0A2P2MXR0_RHIMU